MDESTGAFSVFYEIATVPNEARLVSLIIRTILYVFQLFLLEYLHFKEKCIRTVFIKHGV